MIPTYLKNVELVADTPVNEFRLFLGYIVYNEDGKILTAKVRPFATNGEASKWLSSQYSKCGSIDKLIEKFF